MESPPVILYRFGNWLHRHGLSSVAKLVSWANRFLFAVWLPSSAKIGRPFKIGYWGLGVVMHSDVVVGDNSLISQNVTLARYKKNPGVPRLGDRVYVGPGTVIVGDVEIGDDVIIGANSLVNKSIPSGSVAFGCPARVVRGSLADELSELLQG